ncbi:MAG: hypothetical protein KGO82_10650 [Bacteroidota bacterium]|nr:hypothetical protein [Bacteroidota bacterium]
MKKTLLLLAVVIVANADAQSYSHVGESNGNPFLSDVNGRPLLIAANYATEGSPFFLNDYRPARIVLMDGKSYSNVKVKYNVAERLVQYLDKDGKEMIADKLVRTLELRTPETGENFLLESAGQALNSTGATVYQVLDSGSVRLLKKIVITSREDKPYTSASTIHVFDRKESLFYQTPGGQPQKLERNKSFVSGLFKDRYAQLVAYAENNHINFKDEQDLTLLFRYGNAH